MKIAPASRRMLAPGAERLLMLIFGLMFALLNRRKTVD